MFAGGVVVCSGRGCNVTFTNVSFERCTVVAVAGATVTLTACVFSLDPSARHGLALLASGAGTTVHMGAHGVEGCTIEGGLQGVSVQAGAKLHASCLVVTQVSVVGVEVTGAGSQLELHNCDICSFPRLQKVGIVGVHELNADSSEEHESLNVAVAVRKRSSAHLNQVKVRKVGCGVEVDDASATLVACTVEDVQGGACLEFGNGARGAVKDCTLMKSRDSGISASGAKTKVDVSDCGLQGHWHGGLYIWQGAQIAAQRCHASGNKEAGYVAADDGTLLTLTDCESTGDQIGCSAKEGGKLVATRVTVDESVTGGIVAWEGGKGACTECVVTAARDRGVVVCEAGNVSLKKCAVRSCMREGVYVNGAQSKADLSDCEVQDAGAKPFIGFPMLLLACVSWFWFMYACLCCFCSHLNSLPAVILATGAV